MLLVLVLVLVLIKSLLLLLLLSPYTKTVVEETFIFGFGAKVS